MKKQDYFVQHEKHAATMLALRYGIKLEGEWIEVEVVKKGKSCKHETDELTANYKDSKGVKHQFILCVDEKKAVHTVKPVKDWNKQFNIEQHLMFALFQRDGGHKNDDLFKVDEILCIRGQIISKSTTLDDLRKEVKKRGGYAGDDPQEEERTLSWTPIDTGKHHISKHVKLLESRYTKYGSGMIKVEGLLNPLFMSPKWSTLQEVMEKAEAREGEYVRIVTTLKTRAGYWKPTKWFSCILD